jgi:hypothetical protein
MCREGKSLCGCQQHPRHADVNTIKLTLYYNTGMARGNVVVKGSIPDEVDLPNHSGRTRPWGLLSL